MAEIKREIRTLGQRLSGLTAGNTYTFVLKRPNVRVDVFNAIRGLEIAEEQVTNVRKLLANLEQLRDKLSRGSADSARAALAGHKNVVREIAKGISDAKEFALRAADDAKDAHADVKGAYNEAKDGVEQVVAIAEGMMGGIGDVMKSLAAMCIEAELREPPAEDNASADSSSAG